MRVSPTSTASNEKNIKMGYTERRRLFCNHIVRPRIVTTSCPDPDLVISERRRDDETLNNAMMDSSYCG